jgi:biopolymer transport protein ExbD
MSLPELSRQLMTVAARPKQPVIRIRADSMLQWQQVVRVMDEVKKHNLTKITFDTEAR